MSILLITGGTGLVGSAFKQGIKVSSKDYDLRKKEDVDRMLQNTTPDYVVHTAARVGGIGANMAYPADFYYDNVMMNTNVIDAAKSHSVKKLVCFLSTCVFPDKIEYPLAEDKVHLGPPHTSNYAYAYAKRAADIQIRAYNQQFDTKYFSVIPTNVYGYNDNYNLENGHVIPMLIHKCYLAKQNNTDFEVWGSGKPLREFIFADDVADIIEKLLETYQETEPVIISTSTEYTIEYVAELIAKSMNFEGKIKWLTDKPDGQFRKPSSNGRLLNVVGDYNFTPIEVGIQKTVDYFISNYEFLRK